MAEGIAGIAPLAEPTRVVGRIDATRAAGHDKAAGLVPAVVLIRRLRHGRGTQEAERDGSGKRNQSLTAGHTYLLFCCRRASALTRPRNSDASQTRPLDLQLTH